MKRLLAIVLTSVMLLSALCVFTPVNAAGLSVGDIVKCGTYPQSEVKDETLIAELNEIPGDWISYDYYCTYDYYTDEIKYRDVELDGERYRGVTFTTYRVDWVGRGALFTTRGYQDDNGYFINNIYWFKYEPVQWRVLDPQSGLVLSESIIDAQEFFLANWTDLRTRDGEDCYASSYKHSRIRAFLTDNFYNLAFTADEKEKIIPTTIGSNDWTAQFSEGNGDVTDSVFLLSHTDMLNSAYGFGDDWYVNSNAKRAYGTDYAKAQGLAVCTETAYLGASNWWMRSANNPGYLINRVDYRGQLSTGNCVENCTGVRPAMCLNLQYFEPLAGDIDGDGAVTSADVTYLRSVFAGHIGRDTLVLASADLNGDGVVNAKGLLILRKTLAA